MAELRLAVIGLGSMGARHVEACRNVAGVKLVSGVTRNAQRQKAAQRKWQLKTTTDYRSLIGQVDVVTVATPTYTHAEIAEFFLRRGVHVLVEKPIAATEAQASRMIEAAEFSGACLMVGHVERFNPAFIRLSAGMRMHSQDNEPMHIQAYRMGPFDGRIRDVCVIVDLMIHDIDLATMLAEATTWDVQRAQGMAHIVTPRYDVAFVDFTCKSENAITPTSVQLFASRTNETRRRVIQVQRGNFVGKADLFQQRVWFGQNGDELVEVEVDQGNALELQLSHFIASVRSGTSPAITGAMGRRALQIGLAARELIQANNDTFYASTHFA